MLPMKKQNTLRLNCDLGEGVGNDAAIYPLIDQANIACGGHAGSEQTMEENIRLAKSHGVEIGAHPGYPDPENFGRISISMNSEALAQTVREQIGRLETIAHTHGLKLGYVKPHGALYNDMMRDESIFESIVRTVSQIDPRLELMILSSPRNETYETIATRYDIPLRYELFADRNYTAEGHLVPRTESYALLHNPVQIVERIRHYLDTGFLEAYNGIPLRLRGDSLCVHGDNPEAIAVIEALRDAL